MKIALQLYTVRDHCETGEELLSTLKEVKQAGYDGVEFAGTREVDAETMKHTTIWKNCLPIIRFWEPGLWCVLMPPLGQKPIGKHGREFSSGHSSRHLPME